MTAIAIGCAMHDMHWTDEDRIAESERIKRGRLYLERWSRWQRATGIRLDYSPTSTVVPVVAPEEPQAGARHVSVMPPDDEAMAVDGVLAQWRVHRKRYWKLIRVEYMTGGSSEQKARRCGFGSRADYRKRLESIQGMVADAVDGHR